MTAAAAPNDPIIPILNPSKPGTTAFTPNRVTQSSNKARTPGHSRSGFLGEDLSVSLASMSSPYECEREFVPSLAGFPQRSFRPQFNKKDLDADPPGNDFLALFVAY
jgi:hypothetical protein